jgi:zinc transporter ZupT
VFSAPVIAVTVAAILCAFVGIWLTSMRDMARRLVPFGGGALLGVALFWVLPEMAESMGGLAAILWLASGGLLLAVIDRYVYPVCPSCSPAHDHEHCSTRLHGFAMPLLIASALHSALDGWSMVAAQDDTILSAGFLTGIAVHKVPEGLALGVIARASLRSRGTAFLWCAVAQSATLLGAAAESVFAPYLGSQPLHALLAVAGGSFLYLGWHAVHGEFRRSGASPALVPALTGVAGSSVLRFLLR